MPRKRRTSPHMSPFKEDRGVSFFSLFFRPPLIPLSILFSVGNCKDILGSDKRELAPIELIVTRPDAPGLLGESEVARHQTLHKKKERGKGNDAGINNYAENEWYIRTMWGKNVSINNSMRD